MRKLTLNRDVLLELDADEMRSVSAAGATQPDCFTNPGCFSKLVDCSTADTWCELTQGC